MVKMRVNKNDKAVCCECGNTREKSLELYDIYISTKSACSIKDDYSLAVYEATNDYNLAKTSVRISLSYKTTEEDIKNLFNVFDKIFEM